MFITTEDDGTDLIVSFAVVKYPDGSDIESLTLLRTPKYEFVRDDDERGVGVSFERFLDDSARDLLEEVRYSKDDRIVALKTGSRRYRLDVRKVEPDELTDMCKVLRKMNFDHRFRLTGV